MKKINSRDVIDVVPMGVILTHFGRFFLLDKRNKDDQYWVIPDNTELYEKENGLLVALYDKPRWVKFINCPMVINISELHKINVVSVCYKENKYEK